MESPKNLLKGDGTANNQTANKNTQWKVPEPKKNNAINNGNGGSWGSNRGWMLFVLGLIVGAAVTFVFVGDKDTDDLAMNGNATTTEEGLGDSEESNSDTTGGIDIGSILGGGSLSENGNSGGTTVTGPKSALRRPAEMVSGSNEISVQNQNWGMNVDVELAKFSVSGWVAIHEDDSSRPLGLGNILGARRLDPGIHLTVVPLLRGTVAGGTYHAVMYVDDGDRQFDTSKDAPLKDADGKLIESVFTAN